MMPPRYLTKWPLMCYSMNCVIAPCAHTLRSYYIIIMYTSQSCYVKWGNEHCGSFNVSNGAKQGGVISPLLFRGGFLIRRSSAIRRFFAGFLRCDSRTIMKSFLKKIARKFTGNLHKNCIKFPENSRAILLRNDFIIVRLSHLRNPAKNLQIAELRLMRNPPQVLY